MLWIIALGIAFGLMSFSKKAWGNPLAIFGFLYLGGCVLLLLSILLKVVRMSLS